MCSESDKVCCWWMMMTTLKLIIIYQLDYYILFDATFTRLESVQVLEGDLYGSCEPAEKNLGKLIELIRRPQ